MGSDNLERGLKKDDHKTQTKWLLRCIFIQSLHLYSLLTIINLMVT